MSSDNDNLINALVAEYLSKVSPGIAKKFKVIFTPSILKKLIIKRFQSKHSSPNVGVSLNEVVSHFSKTAPPKRKLLLGVNDGPGAKKNKTGDDTEDSESDSSSGESEGLDQEVEISFYKDANSTKGKATICNLCFVVTLPPFTCR